MRMRSGIVRMRSSLVRMRSSLERMRSSLERMRSSLVRVRSSLVIRASDCQCTSCNGPGFNPSILQHSVIGRTADVAVLNIVRKKTYKSPPKILNKKNIVKEPYAYIPFVRILALMLHRVKKTIKETREEDIPGFIAERVLKPILSTGFAKQCHLQNRLAYIHSKRTYTSSLYFIYFFVQYIKGTVA